MTTSYIKKVQRVRTNSLIGYWPMNDESGTVVRDYGPNGYKGTAALVSMADRGLVGPDGGPCYKFNGSTSYVDIYTAQPKQPTTIGTAMIWFACDKNVLDAATLRQLLILAANATTNAIKIEHTATANTFRLAYIAGSTTDAVSPLIYSQDTDQYPHWHCLAMTWSASANALKVYVDGLQSSTTQGTLGTWSGNMASTLMVIGSSSTTAANVWSGWLAHCAIWSVVLTDAEIKDLAVIGP